MTDDNNRVHLVGRISADPETRALPSGDELVTFRLVVRRGAAARKRSKQVVDTIECTVWRAALRRSVTRLSAGTEVAVEGQLRRRFTSGRGGVASWVSVEVDSCRRVAAPAVASDP
jgi:single-strand DNA-binding protein